MSGLVSELMLALEVLKRWETLAALAVFLAAWSLFRYVALVQRRPAGFRFYRPRRTANPAVQPQEPRPEDAVEEPEEE